MNRTIGALGRARSEVHVLDLDAQLCPHGAPRRAYRGVADVRPDGAHFSDEGAHALADWIMGAVGGVG